MLTVTEPGLYRRDRPDLHARVIAGDGSAALRFVLSANVHRRHLGETQRGIIAARLATLPNHRPAKAGKLADLPTQSEAGELLRVSERTVRSARKVLDSGDADLIAACERAEFDRLREMAAP